jgi:hypothetical protein
VWEVETFGFQDKKSNCFNINQKNHFMIVQLILLVQSFFLVGDDGKSQIFSNDNSTSEWMISSFEYSCESVAVNIEIEIVVFGSMGRNIAVCSS